MLPKLPTSPSNPNHPDVSPADLLERLYLEVPDENWSTILADDIITTDGPVVTGDPVIDKWEAELFNRLEGGNSD